MADLLRLIVTPHREAGGFHVDRFEARLDGELIVTSRRPLYDGARALLERGHPPGALLTMRHVGKPYDSFHPRPLGELAAWTVEDRDRNGARRRRWKERPAFVAIEGQERPRGVPQGGAPTDPRVGR